jgi:hypothetical protein
VTDGITNAGLLPAAAGGSYTTLTFASSPSITNTTVYAIGAIADGTQRYYFDTGAGTQSYLNDVNSYASPANIDSPTNSARQYSAYITYTAGGGGGAAVEVETPAFQEF